jgi:hypothetical protein
MKRSAAFAATLSICVAGCATSPNKISAAYVSPLKYQNYDCQQIGWEQANIERRTNQLYHRLKGRNTSDKWMMGLGLFVAWPALLFMKGNNGAENTEYAQLKGDYEALRTVAVQRRCELAFSSDLATTVSSPAASSASGFPALDAGARRPGLSADPGDKPGTIDLGAGVKLVPAKTASGYCIKALSGYVGTGSTNKPTATSARPICTG